MRKGGDVPNHQQANSKQERLLGEIVFFLKKSVTQVVLGLKTATGTEISTISYREVIKQEYEIPNDFHKSTRLCILQGTYNLCLSTSQL